MQLAKTPRILVLRRQGRPTMWLSFIALTTIFPAVAQAFRGRASRDAVFWGAMTLGIAGPLMWVAVHYAQAWQTGLSATLWVTIAASMTLYAIVAVAFRPAWRLSPLIAGYMLLLGFAAILLQDTEGESMQATPGDRAWVSVHIATAVVTYGLVTIAAVSAFAAFLQERTLKRKRTTALTRHLPSIAEFRGSASNPASVRRDDIGAWACHWNGAAVSGKRSLLADKSQDRADAGGVCRHRRAADGATLGGHARAAGGESGIVGLSSAHPRLPGSQVRHPGFDPLSACGRLRAVPRGRGLDLQHPAYLMCSIDRVVTWRDVADAPRIMSLRRVWFQCRPGWSSAPRGAASASAKDRPFYPLAARSTCCRRG